MINTSDIHVVFYLQTPEGDDAGKVAGSFPSLAAAARHGATIDNAVSFETMTPQAGANGATEWLRNLDTHIVKAEAVLTFSAVLDDVRARDSFRAKTPEQQQSIIDTYREYLPADAYYAKVGGKYIQMDNHARAYDSSGLQLVPKNWDNMQDYADDGLHVLYLTLDQIATRDLNAGQRHIARDMPSAVFNGMRHGAACFYIMQPQSVITPDGDVKIEYGGGKFARHFLNAHAVMTGGALAKALQGDKNQNAADDFTQAANPVIALLLQAKLRHFAVLDGLPVPLEPDDEVYDRRGNRIWPATWPLDPRNAKPFKPK